MHRLAVTVVFVLGLSSTANADIWRWVDMQGNDHYVTTNKAIYTWLDEYGAVNFSDKPDHPDAIPAKLIWHSSDNALANVPEATTSDEDAYPNETPEERAERMAAEAYYCRQAKDIYETYRNAPELYRTDDDGERFYLTPEETAKVLAETEATVQSLCS